jgi:hypothetical protein
VKGEARASPFARFGPEAHRAREISRSVRRYCFSGRFCPGCRPLVRSAIAGFRSAVNGLCGFDKACVPRERPSNGGEA